MGAPSKEDMTQAIFDHIHEEEKNSARIETLAKLIESMQRVAAMHQEATPEEHIELIRWWREEMERQRQRRERIEKVKQSVLGYLAVAVISGVVSLGVVAWRHVLPYLPIHHPGK